MTCLVIFFPFDFPSIVLFSFARSVPFFLRFIQLSFCKAFGHCCEKERGRDFLKYSDEDNNGKQKPFFFSLYAREWMRAKLFEIFDLSTEIWSKNACNCPKNASLFSHFLFRIQTPNPTHHFSLFIQMVAVTA